jgi:mycofactocin precursor
MADSPSPDRIGETTGTEPVNLVDEDVLAEDVLVEEVSIDGMCGVY